VTTSINFHTRFPGISQNRVAVSRRG
jgi:hypothetical protein